ncbi:MAG TPA: hypothetical protein VK468_02315 [Pyrinomonadaceae bacterium]|nr:hypothetical protein [Pyrinomonadaceae bacterium]
MHIRLFSLAIVASAIVLFSYGGVQAQIVDKVKDATEKAKDVTVDAADKVKDVTVDTTKKTTVVVTDNLSKAADKTGDAVVGTTKAAASKTKSFGSHAVSVTDNVVGQSYEGGKWAVVTTWDGTKWVSKRTWFATKKAIGDQ